MKYIGTTRESLWPDLSPTQRLAFEMLAGAAEIIRSAIQHGYLTPDMELTPKGDRIGFGEWGKCDGFHNGLILNKKCILDEVRFLNGAGGVACMAAMGIDYCDPEELSGMVQRMANRSGANTL